ncbi:MAG: hypothetical protein J1E57_10265 [Prevotella sp.]|nr:hypothetical protein [Prevotella sp.]
MKKYFFLITFLICALSGTCQNIIVNQYNNTEIESSHNAAASQMISGVPLSMDIGGVEMQTTSTGGYFRGASECPWEKIVFTNYNSVPVTVLYEFYDGRDRKTTSQSIVLKANETKSSSRIVAPSDIKMIVIQNDIKNATTIVGVEASRETTGGYYQGDPYMPWALYNFTNYNTFPVSVSYTLYDARNGNTSGTVVLQSMETKTRSKYVAPTKFSMKVRKLN